MAGISYLDFDLLIDRREQGYQVQVVKSPTGDACAVFSLPFSNLEVDEFLLRIGRPRRTVRHIGSSEREGVRAFGTALFRSVFKDTVGMQFHASLSKALEQGSGLRLRLHLTNAPELVDIPWEYLFDPDLGNFIGLSVATPLVRYLALPQSAARLIVEPPLSILVMVSSPSDFPPLDVSKEWSKLKASVTELERTGVVTLELLETASLAALQHKLRQGSYHIFHFIGHGEFNTLAQDGLLLLTNEHGRSSAVSGRDLGTMLHDHRSLRLVVLNSCEGGRASHNDPFSGAAQSLVQQGIPAVIAMQFEITDEAAITLAHEFYSALADGYPVDAALAEARKGIFATGNDVEWGTPVLYLRSPDGHIFDVARAVEGTKSARPPVHETTLPLKPIVTFTEPAGQDFVSAVEKFKPIRTFRTSLATGWSCFIEGSSALWVCDGKQVELFQYGSSEPIERWFLPELRWKSILPVIWQGNLVCSDWDGNIWLSSRDTRGRGERLHQASYSDLPVHRLVTGTHGELIAATWDGRIMTWDSKGQQHLRTSPGTMPYLPLSILPCPEGRAAVVDQGGYLRLLDATGKELWAWHADGKVSNIWHDGAEGERIGFFLLLDQQRVAQIRAGEHHAQSISLGAPIRHVSHLMRQAGDGETVVAVVGRGLEWLSWWPLRVITHPKAPHDFDPHECVALCDPERKAARIALALDESGKLFSLEDYILREYPTQAVRSMQLDSSGHFVCLALEETIDVYRNPAFPPTAPAIKLERVEGDLKVGRYQQLRFIVKNTGSAPIGRIQARLDGKAGYVVSQDLIDQRATLVPGEVAVLSFRAKANEAGDLSLVLHMELEDEAGPPEWSKQFETVVTAYERR